MCERKCNRTKNVKVKCFLAGGDTIAIERTEVCRDLYSKLECFVQYYSEINTGLNNPKLRYPIFMQTL